MKRVLSLILALGLLAGCSANTDGGDARKPMGRYIETEGAKIGDLSRVSDFRAEENGDLTFYAQSGETVKRYTVPQSGGAVQTVEEPWLTEIANLGYYPNGGSLSSDGAGTVYALCQDQNGGNALFRTTDGGNTYEQIKVSDWNEVESKGVIPDAAEGTLSEGVSVKAGSFSFDADGEQPRYVSGVCALSGGGFVLGYADKGAARYTADGVKTAEFLGSAFGGGMAVNGNQLLLRSTDSKELWLYDLEKTERTGAFTYENLGYTTVLGMDADGLFLGDSTGLYRQGVDGSIWEKLVDGDLTSLVMPDQEILGLTGDGSGGFWAILRAGEETRMVRYAYDPETPTNPDTELTVFSLKDNATVRQTIGEFQRRYPNVRVNFRVAQTDDGTATVEDVIRALNTELLGGKAPDILLLDGLPVDSYMDKNVLADITDLVKGLTESQGLLENLMGAFEKDGKIYGVPSRFSFPVMMGSGEAMDGATSLETLVGQVRSRKEEPIPFLNPPTQLWEDNGMMMDYYNACVNSFASGREVDRDGLERYFKNMLELNSALREQTPQSGDSAFVMTAVSTMGASGFEAISMGPMSLGSDQALFHIQELGGMMNLQNILGNLGNKAGYRLDTLFGGSAYTPVGAVGITASGEQQDLAKSFVELLLSPTVQDKYLYDGFPVNGNSLDKMTAEQMEDMSGISWSATGGTDAAGQPAGQTGGDMGFTELCRGLDTPILVDEVIKAAVEEQIKGLLNGSLTPADAAENVVRDTELYRAE